MLCTQLCSFLNWWPRLVTASSQRISLSQLLTNSKSSTRHFVFHKCYQGFVSEVLCFYSPPFWSHKTSSKLKCTFPAHWGNPRAEDRLSHNKKNPPHFSSSCRKMQATNAEILANAEILHSVNRAGQGFHSNKTHTQSIHSIVETVKVDHG